MATYEELYSLHNDSALRNKVLVACTIAAETIHNEDGGTANHANRLIWAAAVFANPKAESDRMYPSLVAANEASTVGNIQGATDAAIQADVDAHIDLFATGS